MEALAGLIGESSPVHAVRDQIRRLVGLSRRPGRLPPVLIQGETGTGKGLVAGLLHRAGARAAGPFVDINCAAIPHTLLEVELFGFERGAFTDARQAKAGLFQTAHGGTLFLDEVGSLPFDLQAKLLKAIEDRAVRRIGGTRSEAIDTWILSATNADLRAAIAQERFRGDLYHRLGVVTIVLPPLRERGQDILLLAERLLSRACAEYGLPPRALHPEARSALLAYAWPGNVRELSNVIERAVLQSDEAVITPGVLGLTAVAHPGPGTRTGTGPRDGGAASPGELADAIRDHLLMVLEQTQWNISRAAERLGITRTTLRARIRRHRLRPGGDVPATRPGRPQAPPPSPAVPAGRAPGPPGAPPGTRWEIAGLTLLRLTLTSRAGRGSPFEHANRLNVLLDKARTFGGRVEESGPDGGIVAFGLEPAEDAPRRAAHAAIAMQRAARTDWNGPGDVSATIAIDRQDLMVDRGQHPPQIDMAAKVEAWARLDAWLACAEPGTVLVSSPAAGPLRRWFELLPTTGPHPGPAYRLAGRERSGLGPGGRIGAFVGRRHELDLLGSRLGLARQGRGQVIGVSGEAGIGKSRLLYEFQERLRAERATCLRGSCLSYGKDIPHLPLLDILRQVCGITETDDDEAVGVKVRQAILELGMAPDTSVAYLCHFLGIRSSTGQLAGTPPRALRAHAVDALAEVLLRQSWRRPLVLMVEDVHWMDRSSEDAVASLVDGLASAPALLLCTYRPGHRPSWLEKSYATQIALPPLSAEDSLAVVRSVLPQSAVPSPVVQAIVARADGNPLFLEELSRSAMEGEQAGTLPGREVPESIRAVLRARIDRLAPEDKALLELAAIVGTDVPSDLLADLSELDEEALRRGVGRLQAAELLHETRHGLHRAFAFKHALTHDVACAGLGPERRRAAHGRVIDAVERHYRERRAEHIDALAFHAIQAELLDTAVDYLREAGARAYALGGLSESLARYQQALDLILRLPATPENTRRAIDVRLDLHAPLFGLGNVPRVTELHAEAYELARQLGDLPRLGRIASRMGNYSWAAARYDVAFEHAQGALVIAAATDEPEVRINATHILGLTHLALGEYPRAIEALKRNVDGPDGDLARQGVGFTISAYIFGCGLLAWSHAALGDFDRALAYGARGVAEAERAGHPQARAASALYLATALMMRGEFEAVLPLCEASARLHDADAVRFWRSLGHSMLGWALAWAGRASEGLGHLEQGARLQEQLGIAAMLSVFCSRWAEGFLLAGDLGGARETGARALELATAAGEKGYEAEARHLLAQTAAAGGRPDVETARRHFEGAMTLADGLGMRPLLARCHLGLGRLRRRTGASEEAGAELRGAAAMLRSMGMGAWLGQAEAELEQLAARRT